MFNMPTDLRKFIDHTLGLWHVPGLALAVVKDGQVNLVEGFGHRNLTKAELVTPDTLFPIASCSKAFTAFSLGLLVDSKALDWDKPVKDYLHAFKLWDPYATDRITPRDLLTHRSGLPGHDMMWYGTRYNRHEIFDRLRYLEPTRDLRTSFQYQNLMYMVAGLLIEEIAGISWEQFVQRRILEPLCMDRTSFSAQLTQLSPDHAAPYRFWHDKIAEMPFEAMVSEGNPTAGASGIYSCATDMAKWVLFLLNHGNLNGRALISETTFQEMFTPQIVLDHPFSRSRFGFEFMSYGLGWVIRMHKGQIMAEHDGQSDGFTSLTSLIPRAGLGIVALTNADSYYNPVQDNQVPNIVTYTLYDHLLGLVPTDWNTLYRTDHDEQLKELEQVFAGMPLEQKTGHPPSHPIECYLGDYEHPGFGRISIRQDGENLLLVMNEKLALPMVPSDYDVFEIVFEIAGQRQKIVFATNLDGAIHQVAIHLDPRVNAVLFNRV